MLHINYLVIIKSMFKRILIYLNLTSLNITKFIQFNKFYYLLYIR